jgi:hypothetical protein
VGVGGGEEVLAGVIVGEFVCMCESGRTGVMGWW